MNLRLYFGKGMGRVLRIKNFYFAEKLEGFRISRGYRSFYFFEMKKIL
jgi:hypothetical protein